MKKVVEKHLRQEQERLDEAWKRMMKDEGGRRIINFLLEKCHLYHSIVSEANVLNYIAEGERRIGLIILKELEKFPEDYLEMQRRTLKDKQYLKNLMESKNESNDTEEDSN